jgi:hypothetical protein
MHKSLYILLALGGLSVLTPSQAHATAAATASITAVAYEKTAGTDRNIGKPSLLGLGNKKKVTSPAKLSRQLHSRQNQLKAKARRESRANRRRFQQG